ncbi:MAG: DNA repair ATPase, partial [Pseudomonadales bacterium]|nr:DNA repair ATPase [Pseudomonadales bacterium]
MVDQTTTDKSANAQVENAVADGSAYDIIRKRLKDQASQLESTAQAINDKRLAEFGSTEMKIMGRARIRTENNCVARDVVRVGEHLLFGCNVFIGLKKQTEINDVFSVFKILESESGIEIEPVDLAKTFLNDPRFVSDFNELYTYYKQTRLNQLRINDGKLLASFQIGERISDIRVFRWSLSPDGSQVDYIDNRGERDIQLPPSYDFEWVEADRELVVDGRHPHINVLDTLFVDTIGGDLTIKVEDNTRSGEGIYQEPVEDSNQSLDDADFFFASVGQLILLKIKPYQEEEWRYLVFNRLSQEVTRIDAIGESCVQLPEDHGIVFPGGYYLQSGEYKTFDDEREGLRFKRAIRSPNGEDVLFVFYEIEAGLIALYPYNLIEKQLRNPLYAHGYGLFEDGRMAVFYAEDEPTRVHPMQIWQTPFVSDVYASQQLNEQSLYGKIGNAELVRGISELLSVVKLVNKPDPRAAHYNEVIKVSSRLFDQYHWLTLKEHQQAESLLRQIIDTAELIIDEYEKVESIQKNSLQALQQAEVDCQALLKKVQPEGWSSPQPFVTGLADIRHMRGHLITIKDYRYIDVAHIEVLQAELEKAQDTLASQTVDFLAKGSALNPIYDDLKHYEADADKAKTRAEIVPVIEKIESLGAGLDLLTETMSSITSADATVRTTIIENISTLYGHLNQSKARTENKLKGLGLNEAKAQFSAQFKLLSQSVTNAITMATTPEKCDEQLSRLMAQLQELESQFSEYEQFLTDILDKRDEIFETFESHKQQLIDARQRKSQTLFDAAGRILTSIKRRVQKISDDDELNTFFASDTLVEKIRDLTAQLRELDDAVKADELEAQFKATKDQTIRGLRDKTEIYEDGGSVIKLGPKHKFSVNTQELDLTILPRGEELFYHLSGTEYYEKVNNPVIERTRPYWNMSLVSETPSVYRSEFLAYSILQDSEQQKDGLSIDKLIQASIDEKELHLLTKEYASPRYKEGYERGIHDHDAAKILVNLLPIYQNAGLLRFDPKARAFALLTWSEIQKSNEAKGLPIRAKSALQMLNVFGKDDALTELEEHCESFIKKCLGDRLTNNEDIYGRSASYLARELAKSQEEFVHSKASATLIEQFRMDLKAASGWQTFEEHLRNCQDDIIAAYQFSVDWLNAYAEHRKQTLLIPYISEAAAILVAGPKLRLIQREVELVFQAEGLLGSHPLIEEGKYSCRIDDFILRLDKHISEVIPGYKDYHQARHEVIEQEKAVLKLDQFKARPLTSFVRNKLINEAYLPIIGDNLAKQMGTVGENKRTDLMGLLMMISPPGYGKTTLMEYVASRLGLIFMKINCPSIGHHVDSLDPAQAPNATAKQELEKLNLGLEMGNNTMLYLDDIQHTNAEFLRKFISLCDGTRRIEGVWRGETKTYDLRGKKFCVVMAGNPYTESGELFKIPDMLANRADIYNLGDVLGGMDEVFALSYIENSMTSNPVLAPLATRDMDDFYRFVDRAKGRNVADTDFSHPYSQAESNEITETLNKMFAIQDVVLKVNQGYIHSAAQDDKYRTEPPFKLQGSYRNMNKMAEKISAVMTDSELEQLIDDHYQGESQLLTKGTEENLLKLAELRNTLDKTSQARWLDIKKEFMRQKSMGGDAADVGTKVVAQLHDLVEQTKNVQQIFADQNSEKRAEKLEAQAQAALEKRDQDLQSLIRSLNDSQQQVEESISKALTEFSSTIGKINYDIQVVNKPMPGVKEILSALAATMENSIFPLVKAMDGKIGLDLKTHEYMKNVST